MWRYIPNYPFKLIKESNTDELATRDKSHYPIDLQTRLVLPSVVVRWLLEVQACARAVLQLVAAMRVLHAPELRQQLLEVNILRFRFRLRRARRLRHRSAGHAKRKVTRAQKLENL